MSFITKLTTGALPLFGGLSQEQTNGRSLYGTTNMPRLPDFLTNNPIIDGYPWGSLRADSADPSKCPSTGVTRYYNFNIARGQAAPDGLQQELLLINGQYPGPLIEANWGDWISITVKNNLTAPEEGTAFHWHGFLQKETPWYDGVPSVTQCPIAPGSSFTYRFRADRYGTTFYHSHYSGQLAGGATGPMVIHGPKSADYDIDVGPVMLSDFFHRGYDGIIDGVMSTDPVLQAPASDNNMINGKMNTDCKNVTGPCVTNAGLSNFHFESGKTHLIRVINSGAANLQYFSIDEHELEVIANDFVPIQPYKTNFLTLGVGQRSDVLVRGKSQPKTAYWMRSKISNNCALRNQPWSLATIHYDDQNATEVPSSMMQDYDHFMPNGTNQTYLCANDDIAKTVPVYVQPADDPSTTTTVQVELQINATGHQIYLQNNQTFRGDFNHPLLLLANEKNYSYPYNPEWSVYNFGSNQTIRLVVENDKNMTQSFPHPMHLHGTDFQVLAEGPGYWDGKITNPENPQRRDTQILRPGGHIVMQFESNNPGVWALHCHVAWHVSQGLYINVMTRPEDIRQMEIPMVMAQTCRDWDAWSARNVVQQLDSGL